MMKLGRAAVTLFALSTFIGIHRAVPIDAQNIGFGGLLRSDVGAGHIGYASETDTTAATMAAAPGAGNSNFLYWARCVNTSTTAAVAIIKQGTTAVAAIPCPLSVALGEPIKFYPPLRIGINAAMTMEANTSATTVYFTSFVRTARSQ